MLYTVLLVVANVLGYALRLSDENIVTLWLPAGAGLAILLAEERRRWPALVALIVGVDVLISLTYVPTAPPPAWSVFFAAIAALEITASAALITRAGCVPLELGHVRSVVVFLLVALFVTALGALAGAAGVVHLDGGSFVEEWQQWWLADALGMILVAPVALFFLGRRPVSDAGPAGWGEGVLLLVGLASAGWATYDAAATPAASVLDVRHVVLPFLMWAALRFGWGVVSMALLLTANLVILEAMERQGPFVATGSSALQHVLSLQVFLAVTAVSVLMLSAYVASHRRSERQVLQEINRRELAEARRREMEAQLHQAHKMETIGRLASGMAHDVNNVLTVVQGHADLLEEDLAGMQHGMESVEAIRKAVRHGSGVTRSLLVFSRDIETPRERFDLGELASETRRLVERTLPANVDVELGRPTDGGPWILGDSTQIQQVFLNLALNARDAMPDGGTLRIAVGDASDAEHGLQAVIRVEDTGSGMSEQVLRRACDPFFTTRDEAGTGLGLSVVHGIVRNHGGTLNISSELGQGTTVEIVLPAVERSLDDTPPVSDAPRGHGETVLLAEDEPTVRSILALHLSQLGYDVLQASNGNEALTVVRDAGPDLRLWVLDLDMPERSGLSCLQELRAEGYRTPAIVLSGSADLIDPDTLDAMTRRLGKPVTRAALGRAVYERLSGSAARPTG